jgi:transcriptional regulator with XRE-family HTH domain
MRLRHTQLRDDRNLTYAELARRTGDAGRPIPVLGVRRIEAGERRVDVDDLMALAAALDVPPATLLMPDTTPTEWEAPVDATGLPEAGTAEQLWAWLTATRPPRIPADEVQRRQREYIAWLIRALPPEAPLPLTVATPEDDHGDD